MASRRTRIKGIANIPQRRKTTTNDDQPASLKLEEPPKEIDNLTFNIEKIPGDAELHIKTPECSTNKSNELLKHNTAEDIANSQQKPSNDGISIISNDILQINSDTGTDNEKSSIIDVNIESALVEGTTNSNSGTKNAVTQNVESNPIIPRRKYIKPTISVTTIYRNQKQKAEKENANKIKNIVTEQIKNDEKSTALAEDSPTVAQDNVLLVENSQTLKLETLTTTNLTDFPTNDAVLDEPCVEPKSEESRSEVPLDKTIRKPIPGLNTSSTTIDTDYPPPPPSPSKINRSRIKAIPRLGYRKTSFSASESEDESRRNHNRNRNDSVCSTTSGVTESIAECMSPQRPKELNAIMQKKCNRTEQSRKLAEARREFERRFGNSKPDRQRLTMIDLIFYNPTTNPMNSEAKSKQVEFNDAAPEEIESEKVDDPSTTKDENESDEENEMPVPQIKIGPSGEIILDEKSLVIESKEVKRQREELQKTRLVDGNFSSSYGVYKKKNRSKTWTQNETLRFYKALNIIGTDFSLMCELFPRRTRREIKMKFKKEERINRTLINRAIMQPCNFDFTELKHEVDLEERELEELEKMKEDEAKIKKQRAEERAARKRKVAKDPTKEENSEGKHQPRPSKIRRATKKRIKKFNNMESILDDSDADVSDIATQSESDGEIPISLRPTRSGRVPKAIKKFDHSETTSVESIIRNNKVPDVQPDRIEPGSIMILTEKGISGEPVYKIYMVTPEQGAAPLNLTSDAITKAIEFKKGLSAQNIVTISANNTDDETENTVEPEENNVTIPEDNVTTLRGDKDASSQDVVEQTPEISHEDNVIIV